MSTGDPILNLMIFQLVLALVVVTALVVGGVLAGLVYRRARRVRGRGWVVAAVCVSPMALVAYLGLAWTAYEKACEWRRVETIGASWREAPVGRGSSLQIAPGSHRDAGGGYLIPPHRSGEAMPRSGKIITIAASHGFVAGRVDRVVRLEDDEERTETWYFLFDEATGHVEEHADKASLEAACERVGMGPLRLVPVREHWAAQRWLVVDIVLLALLAAIPIELGRRLFRRAKALWSPAPELASSLAVPLGR